MNVTCKLFKCYTTYTMSIETLHINYWWHDKNYYNNLLSVAIENTTFGPYLIIISKIISNCSIFIEWFIKMFHPLEAVFRYRDPQLQMPENYSYLLNLGWNICLQILIFRPTFSKNELVPGP